MDKKTVAPRVKRTAEKMKVKRKKQKRFVIVGEETYIVFGPFKSETEVESHLKERGFHMIGQNRWRGRDNGKVNLRVCGVKRPKPVKKQDNPVLL